jgi:hypothetical protein
VAYILQPGDPGYVANVQHGFIAAAFDQSTAPWGCHGGFTASFGTAIGTGAANTTAILNTCTTSGIAAQVCGSLVIGGYTDWYLPSSGELAKLYLNRVAIGSFGTGVYWSSTENGNNNAYSMDFNTGTATGGYGKSTTLNVRAIRSF